MDSFPIKRQKCGKATFDHLPDEIILKILKSLDLNSLKTAAIVHKRCAELVATSSVILSKFKLKLTANVWQSEFKIQEVLSLDRKLQTIEIAGVYGAHDALVKIFKRFGPTMKYLSITCSKIDDFTLREMLKNADKLEILVMKEVVIEKKLPAINPVSMRKLKSLTIHNCEWSIARFIIAQVKSLDIKSYLDEGGKCNLVTLLGQQRLLKSLALRGTSARTLFQQYDVIANCNFDLETFHLDQDFGKNSDNVNWNLSTFLSLHLETLKDVEILGPHCGQINGFIIANACHLDKLTLDVRGLPKAEEFYEILAQEPNTQLRELSLRGFFFQQESIKKILLKFPSIEKLELNDWGNNAVATDMLNFISRNFPNLQQLAITEISNSENLKFAALKNLSVTYIRSTGKLVQFVMRNPSVETLKVGLVYIGQITSNFVDELKDLENVKHLAFGGNEKTLKLILELLKLKRTPESLKTLELSLTSEGNSTVNSGKAMKFHFPITKFDVI